MATQTVFTSGTGRGLDGTTAHLWFRRARAASSLDEALTPHAIRHGFGRTLLANGVPLVEVAAILGHTVATCSKDYADVLKGADAAADRAARMAAALR